MTRLLLTPRSWAGASEAIRSGERLLIGLDLDGTLAPIVRRPELARVPSGTLRILERAARLRRTQIAIVSARPLATIRALLPVRGLARIGQYGLEGPLAPPARERSRLRESCRVLARELALAVEGLPGAWVEPKGLTVAVHNRAVAPAHLRSLRNAVALVFPRARRMGFVPTTGRRVTDFVPAGFDKGTALRGAIAVYGPRRVFYFGDSLSDEAAFRSMGRSDFPVRVGPGATCAPYRVADLRGVTRVLSAVVRLRSGRPHAPWR